MGEKVLTILEVSQKQAYIFASNELRKNITNSAIIAWVLSPTYFETVAKEYGNSFCREKNLVYSGGGHTVLVFDSQQEAESFNQMITRKVYEDYPGLALFVKNVTYDESKNPGENLEILTGLLEKKKSVRSAAFHQGSFGVEKLDPGTRNPVLLTKGLEEKMPAEEEKTDKRLSMEGRGYARVFQFGDLGGSKGDSNFIAVVHIDGNAMGVRVQKMYEENKNLDWDSYRKKLQEFSDNLDKDFKAAYTEMVEQVADQLDNRKLEDLDLKTSHGKINFPVRRIITAGDDICFVSEGRIGIPCAVKFIQALSKKGYAACAGVAIVHQKYPFYRAYELAEELCSSAKRYGATLVEAANGKGAKIQEGAVSAIDWHIEFGEMGDSLEAVRSEYVNNDGEHVELRPYIIHAPEEITEANQNRLYEAFRKQIGKLLKQEEDYAKGKWKELRRVLKQGETATKNYIKFNHLEIEETEGLFDVIELLDTFIDFE